MKNKKTISVQQKQFSVSALRNSYETDYYGWIASQIKLLKKHEFSKLDLVNLIEEIDSLGKSEKQRLTSYLEVLLKHMLKVKFQPKKHTKSWDLSIREANYKVQKTLAENPSLKPKLKEIIFDAYFSGRIEAALETKLDLKKFPEECPWTLIEIFPELEKKYQ